MERKTITIGREPDNMIQINKPDISGHHVRITRTDVNSFFIEDLGSANHTFVDDMPVRKVTICLDEKLRLSKDTFIDLKELFNIKVTEVIGLGDSSEGNSIYIDKFLKLKTLWEETERQKKRIKKKHQQKTALFRLGIMLAIIVIALPFYSMLKHAFIVVTISAGAIASVFNPVAESDELRTLVERFYRNYVCPHCNVKLGQWSWDYYADVDECPNVNCKKSFKK